MASGKRASMREGPLAALFRKTEEEGLHGEGAPQPGQPADARAAEQPREPQARREPEPRREFRAPDEEPELRPAPPSARKHAPTPEEVEERRERRASRSPEQRLREVFSTDIPENIMELSPSESSKPRYGREEPRVPTPDAELALRQLCNARGAKSGAPAGGSGRHRAPLPAPPATIGKSWRTKRVPA